MSTTEGPVPGLLRLPRRNRKLKPERVQEELKVMAGWRLMPGDSAIGRVRDFATAEAATAWALFVSALAHQQDHGYTLERSGNRIAVTLYQAGWSGRPGGVTMAVLETGKTLG
ncbi:MAG: 4a-hydroxytetrahydrobiopterin dehydratase [Thermoanaerobaculia bacterium]